MNAGGRGVEEGIWFGLVACGKEAVVRFSVMGDYKTQSVVVDLLFIPFMHRCLDLKFDLRLLLGPLCYCFAALALWL